MGFHGVLSHLDVDSLLLWVMVNQMQETTNTIAVIHSSSECSEIFVRLIVTVIIFSIDLS